MSIRAASVIVLAVLIAGVTGGSATLVTQDVDRCGDKSVGVQEYGMGGDPRLNPANWNGVSPVYSPGEDIERAYGMGDDPRLDPANWDGC